MLQQLSNLAQATAEITKQLEDRGYGAAAQAIVGVPPIPETLTIPPPEPSVPVPVPGAPLPPAPPIGPPPPPPPPETPPPEPSAVPAGRYLLAGSSIYIPYMSPEAAFHTLSSEWNRAMIGSKRVNGMPVGDRPMYAPDAFVRGSTMDPGMQVPAEATRSEAAFVKWANENGYEKGLSIEVDGLIAPPGRASIVQTVDSEGNLKQTLVDPRSGRPVWKDGAMATDPADDEET